MIEDQGTSGAPIEASGDESKKDTVAYETYKKAVSEAKKAKEQVSIMMAEQEARKQQELSDQGKYKEMVEKLQKDLKAKDDETKRKDAYFIQTNLKSSISKYAKEFGASEQASEDVFEVAKSKGLLSSIEVKDDYSVNEDQVKSALSELQKKSPWFFQKSAQAPKDISMGAGAGGPTQVDLSKLSYDELLRLGKTLK